MNEVDINKVVSFLLKRWERSAYDGMIKASNIIVYRNYLKIEYRHPNLNVTYAFLEIKKTWTLPDILRLHFEKFLEKHECTLANILDFLFKEAKTYEIYALGTSFIYKGESLEEVIVKADLEEIDDRG